MQELNIVPDQAIQEADWTNKIGPETKKRRSFWNIFIAHEL